MQGQPRGAHTRRGEELSLARRLKELAFSTLRAVTRRRPRAELVELTCRLVAELEPAERAEVCGRSLDAELLLGATRQFLARAAPAEAFGLFESLHGLALGQPTSVAYVLSVYGGLLAPLVPAGRPLAGARVLELGPGYSLLGGALLLAWGATSYDGVDPFPVAVVDAELLRALRARLQHPPGLPLRLEPELAARHARILERYEAVVWSEAEGRLRADAPLRLHQVDAADLPFAAGAFDVVLSNAVLEHVRDLPAIARETARVLAPGAVAIHQVDLRDHRDFSRPRDFLTLGAAEWERANQNAPFAYTNRLRASDVRAAFAAAGLELLSSAITERLPLAPAERAALHPDFRDRSPEDLEALGISLVLRRPGADG